jgi:hypothetical protein
MTFPLIWLEKIYQGKEEVSIDYAERSGSASID